MKLLLKTPLIIIMVVILGYKPIVAQNLGNGDALTELLDSLHAVSEEAFNDRSYEEAMKYEAILGKFIPADTSMANRFLTNRADLFLYAAQFQTIDTVWRYANELVAELRALSADKFPEYKRLQLRTLYFDALRKYGNVNDSVAERLVCDIKCNYGALSTEYAEALLLRSVILRRSIENIKEGSYKTWIAVKNKRNKEARKLITNAVSILERHKLSKESIWYSYALSLLENIEVDEKYGWHGHAMGFYMYPNEEYSISENVKNEASAVTNNIYRSIINSIDNAAFVDAISGLKSLASIHAEVRGNTRMEVRMLTLISLLYNQLNYTKEARKYLELAENADMCLGERRLMNTDFFVGQLQKINSNRQRLDSLSAQNAVQGYEEALLTVGSPNYNNWSLWKNEDDMYIIEPDIDVKGKKIDYANLARELIEMFSSSPFIDREILSALGFGLIKEDSWNRHINLPKSTYSITHPAHDEEIYYFDNLNQALGRPLDDIYQSLLRKSNKTAIEWHDLSRCSFYLYDFENAHRYEQQALRLLMQDENIDSKIIMSTQKNITYLQLVDLWFDIWLYSNATRSASIYNDKIEKGFDRRYKLLQKHPEILNNKVENILLDINKFSYSTIPFLYHSLPSLNANERRSLWKEYSAWFYSMLPMMTFLPGVEKTIYDAQLFSKGLLLETAKNHNPEQIRWNDIRDKLQHGEIAIEFINMNGNYSAAIVEHETDSPRIVPLFTKHEYDTMTEIEDLYNSSLGYNLVFAPLEISTDVKRIYFSPSGILNSIALESFCDERGSLLSDRWDLIRLSSTKELLKQDQKVQPQSIALYGGLCYEMPLSNQISESRNIRSYERIPGNRYVTPDNLRYGVDPLRWSLPEIDDIRALYAEKLPDIDIDMYTAISGTEESVNMLQMKRPNILHFSTHGYYWEDNLREQRDYVSFIQRVQMDSLVKEDQAMVLSGIFLAGANNGLMGKDIPSDVEDGILTAQELSEMDFSNTDFVALSACQTGLGKMTGEGVFGLQRGFKLAGVKSLLMSLWPVDDEATKILMVEFYRNLTNGESKSVSLNMAKEYVRNNSEFYDPEYWAGWILLDALN